MNTSIPILPNIIENLGSGIIIIDKSDRIIFTNSIAERLLGLKAKEALFKPSDYLFSEKIILDILNSVKKTEEALNYKITLIKPKKRNITLNVTPIFDENEKYNGSVIMLINTFREKPIKFQLLKQNQRAIIGTLTSWVAHEVRNPLTSMNLHFDLLKEEISENSKNTSKEVKELIETLEEEVERLNNNLNEFLNFGIISSSKKKLHSLNEVVKSIIELVQPEADMAKVDVILKLQEDLPKIQIDVAQMRLVILNLIKNSIQAMPQGGRLEIKTEKRDNKINLKIKDQGFGIPKDDLKNIFDFLYTKKKDGTGLGLTISKKIIKEHGGDIFAKSQVNKGSIFTVTLPISQMAGTEPAPTRN